ncbi:MAG: MTH1187 family thiamine-binding protein [Candidatus Cloacimonetes bacterium]|nr:MTH1187 family thiamine-binding protein [Candidatus Cloacimonadota bacterium]
MQEYNVICDIVVVTYDIGPSLSPFVAEVCKIIKDDPNIKHMLTPMGSIVEGNFDDVMSLVDRIFKAVAPERERIGITVKMDYRRSKKDRIHGKVASVEEKMKA